MFCQSFFIEDSSFIVNGFPILSATKLPAGYWYICQEGSRVKFNVKSVKLVVRECQQKLYLGILKCNGMADPRYFRKLFIGDKTIVIHCAMWPALCVSIDVNNEQEDVNNVWAQLSPAPSPLLAPFPSDMSQTLVTRQRSSTTHLSSTTPPLQ